MRACTWRQRLLPHSGHKLRVHPRAGPLMGAGAGKTQLKEGRAGCEGRGEWAGLCASPRVPWLGGAATAPPPAGPGSPARPGAQTEPGAGRPAWHTQTHPSRHCSCLPASFLRQCPFSSPHPHPRWWRGWGGLLLSCHPLCVPTDLKDLTVSGTPGTANATPTLPKPKKSPATAG